MDNNVAYWGAILCSQVWIASSDGPASLVWAAFWLLLAFGILVLDLRSRRSNAALDERKEG